MRIGLTYDLRDEYLAAGYSELETAEFDRGETMDAIAATLARLGHEVDRVGSISCLVSRLAAGDRWDLVFNIAEGLRGFGREAQVPALLDAYAIPYTFSDPLTCAVTLHKAMCKHVVRGLGLATSDFALIEEIDDIAAVQLPYPLFAKPVAEGTGKGVTTACRVRTETELAAVCADLLEAFQQPVLVETFLPGREFTVGIVGTGRRAASIGVAEVILNESAEPQVYSYHNKEYCESLVQYRRVADRQLVEQAEALALAAWRGLGCRDGGRIDLRLDGDGVPQFLEVNPLAGLHPSHSDLPIICGLHGIAYEELISRILESARLRFMDASLAAGRCAA